MMAEDPIATRFAVWAGALEFSDIPPETIHQARRALLDTVGVICAGAKHNVTSAVRGGFVPGGPGPCSVTGGGKVSTGTAALINGVAAHAYDFDDASHTGIMHGSAIIVPAVLAAMEEVDASDTQALTAIVAGSEIAYVLADILGHRHYLRGWWSTATLTIVGAAAASAKLYGLPRERIAHAIGLAAALAGGSRSVVGSDAKPFLCGYVARTAVELAAAAGSGVAGPVDVFEGENGFFSLLNDRIWNPAPLATLGSTWRLVEPGLLFKPYPVCSSALALVEQSAALRAEHGFGVEAVRQVRCHVPELVAGALVFDHPETPQQGQFSIPFCVACGLHYGEIRLEHLSSTVLLDPDIQSTMDKVQAFVDPDLSTDEMRLKFPESARVEIGLDDDTVLEGTCLLATGMPSKPLADRELAQKFRACTAFANIGTNAVEEAVEGLMQAGSDPCARRIQRILGSLWAGE